VRVERLVHRSSELAVGEWADGGGGDRGLLRGGAIGHGEPHYLQLGSQRLSDREHDSGLELDRFQQRAERPDGPDHVRSTLTAALTGGVSSGTSLSVDALPDGVNSGDTIDVDSGAAMLTFKANGAESAGATTLVVQTAQTPSTTYNAGTSVVDTSWASSNCGANSGWIGTSSVTESRLQSCRGTDQILLHAGGRPETKLTAERAAGSRSQSRLGLRFATPGTGTYASLLCFVDFNDWGTQTAATGLTWSCNASGTPAGALAMSAPITGTPYTLEFCISVSSTDSSGHPVTGSITGHVPVRVYDLHRV